MSSLRSRAVEIFTRCQSSICSALESTDGQASFQSDHWERVDEGGGHGGGGHTRILEDGAIFEQAGVNFSEVMGTLPAEMSKRLQVSDEAAPFFASGTSLVIHPRSPMVPTTHFNVRYLEVGNFSWFGGGMDLTPYYLVEEDAEHFHRVNKEVCDRFSVANYAQFKKECDEYFYLPHRKESRGIGGIFFDYLGKQDPSILEDTAAFVDAVSQSFVDAYIPIVERRKYDTFTNEQKQFQLLRRGRYVEFNLIYDRGTLFGLKTGGRSKSILMSLPKEVSWSYHEEDFSPEGSEEDRLLQVLREPRDWIR